jgi:L-seryl-tRNA(Ser) seleniumtransferase
LARAVRADKTCLAGIAATLRHYARGEAEARIPIWRMIGAPADEIRRRADELAAALGSSGIQVTIEATEATVGGGSLPGETLPSWAVALRATDAHAIDALARRLRTGNPGVFGRIEHDRLLLDLRTVLSEDDVALLETVREAMSGEAARLPA